MMAPILLSAKEVYYYLGCKVNMDAIREAFRNGTLPCVRIQNADCTHIKYVDAFAEELFKLKEVKTFNAGSRHGEIIVTPSAWLNK